MRNWKFLLAATGLLLVAALAVHFGFDGGSQTAAGRPILQPGFLKPRPIGLDAPAHVPAWITDLTIVDLDGDGMKDVIACDATANRVVWLRQAPLGAYAEQPLGPKIAGPVRATPIDFDGDGDLDLLIAAMGIVPPNNARIGAVIILENDGQQRFTPHTVLENTFRVTDVQPGDFNADGRLDLAVAQFGYLEGQVQWLENLGGWRFAEHPLLAQSGGIHAPVVDFNGDGKPDIISLVAQDHEEVWAFENRGGGAFERRRLHAITNKDYGGSGLVIADVDRDGLPDVVFTNGDGFDFTEYGLRPWHGVQWLRNEGGGAFRFQRIGDFPGAYSPVVVDLNGDGHLDVVASSDFNDWTQRDAVSLICFENDGRQNFAPRILAHEPTHLVVVKAADMDNDGDVELVSGCLAFYPPVDRAGRITLWERRSRRK